MGQPVPAGAATLEDLMNRLCRGLGLALAFAIALTGCAPASQSPRPSPVASASGAAASPELNPTSPSPVTFEPTYEIAACPEDVLAVSLSEVECGYLTVLEDRSRPGGRTLRLFATRTDPPGGTTTPDPVFGAAGNLGADSGPGDNSAGAQRVHRSVYALDLRGHDHSEPSLDCPEVRAAGPELAGLRLRDPEHRLVLLTAVTACRDRLLGEDIDLTAYDVGATVADFEDLRRALDLPVVNVNANLNGSRISSVYVRTYPNVVRAFVMDSPALSSPDVLTIGPAALDFAIGRLSDACAEQPACHGSLPDLEAAIRDATVKLDVSPVTLNVDGTVEAAQLGHPIRVVIDGAAYLRYVRYILGTAGGANSVDIVRTTAQVLAGTLEPDGTLASSLADGGVCLGILPGCDAMSFGALFSLVCGTLAPSTDHDRLATDVHDRPAYADVFDPGPLLAPCDVWPVGPVRPAPPDWPIGMPTLVMRGSLDPFSTPPADIATAIGGPTTYLYEVPNQSYNAFGEVDCPRLIRNAWLDAPEAPPADISCLAAIAPINLEP
jgi:pimeloyl-ACP methyl ester carboxylesterase